MAANRKTKSTHNSTPGARQKLLSWIHNYIVFTVSVEVAVEEVISSMSPPRLLVSAVQNAGNSSATGTCQGWDDTLQGKKGCFDSINFRYLSFIPLLHH